MVTIRFHFSLQLDEMIEAEYLTSLCRELDCPSFRMRNQISQNRFDFKFKLEKKHESSSSHYGWISASDLYVIAEEMCQNCAHFTFGLICQNQIVDILSD